MKNHLTRRQFFGRSAIATGLGYGYFVNPTVAQESNSPNERLNLAIVGTGGKGWHNVTQLTDENIVVLCDVDTKKLDQAAEKYPKASRHRDNRKMLDQ